VFGKLDEHRDVARQVIAHLTFGGGGNQCPTGPATGSALRPYRSGTAGRGDGISLAGDAASRVHSVGPEMTRLVAQPHRRCCVGTELGDARRPSDDHDRVRFKRTSMRNRGAASG
jgi:hypothetical protein